MENQKQEFRGSKPGERRGGRVKGTPNKVTVAVKDIIAKAAEMLGGVDRLVAWVKEDPANERVFWGSIYPKLLPLQLTGADGGAIQFEDVSTARDKLDHLYQQTNESDEQHTVN